MSHEARSRRELEMLWQTRLELAARRRGMATVRYLQVIEEYDQPTPSSDGQVAILRAIREAKAACMEHMRVLRIFADLKTLGRLPVNQGQRLSLSSELVLL